MTKQPKITPIRPAVPNETAKQYAIRHWRFLTRNTIHCLRMYKRIGKQEDVDRCFADLLTDWRRYRESQRLT